MGSIVHVVNVVGTVTMYLMWTVWSYVDVKTRMGIDLQEFV